MDRVALDLGFIQIYWYSVFIFLGVFFASMVILRETKKYQKRTVKNHGIRNPDVQPSRHYRQGS